MTVGAGFCRDGPRREAELIGLSVFDAVTKDCAERSDRGSDVWHCVSLRDPLREFCREFASAGVIGCSLFFLIFIISTVSGGCSSRTN